MLLLKGKPGKSFVLEQISKSTNSLVFIYYDQPVIDGGVWVNPDTMEFEDFMFEISEYLDRAEDCMGYDYLIIYTNEDEELISNKKDLIEEWERCFASTVIIGCQ